MVEHPSTYGGKYRVERVLSSDGAVDHLLAFDGDRPVRLKTLTPGGYPDPDQVQALTEEARLASQLAHANVLRVLGSGLEDGRPFIAFERPEGVTLREVLLAAAQAHRHPPPEVAAAVGAQACAALAHAHGASQVHGHLTPDSVLACADGTVKLGGFGVPSDGFARAGRGEPVYQSPEHFGAGTLDARSDLFSLGAILWELATGTPVFVSDDPVNLAHRIRSTPAPGVRSASPDVPEELARIIDAALQTDPARRPASAAEMQRALEQYLRSREGSALEHVRAEYVLASLDVSDLPAAPTSQPSPAPPTSAFSAHADPDAVLELDLPKAAPRVAPVSKPSPPRPPPSPLAIAGPAAAPNKATLAVVAGLAAALAGVGAFVATKPSRDPAPAPAPKPLVEEYSSIAVAISSTPPGAAVSVDGKATGQVTPTTVKVDTGKEHVVALAHPDALPWSESFFAAPKAPVALSPALALGARLKVGGAEATIEVDGKPELAFQSPGTSLLLVPGPHTAVARADGFAPAIFAFEARAGETLDWEPTLEPGVLVQVRSTPAGAAILVDGEATHQVTPAQVYLKPGPRRALRLELPGHLPVSRTIAAKGKGPLAPVEVTLLDARAAKLNAEIKLLVKKLARRDQELKALRAKTARSDVISNPRREIALQEAIQELEGVIGREEADLADLKAELAALR